MPEDITLFDALYSQRAIRYFTDQPVPDETIHRLIEAATKAPSGGNRQGWKFLVIRDQAAKDVIAGYYEKAWERAYGSENPNPPDIQSHVRRSADHLARHMAEVPVLIMACIEHGGEPSSMGRGGPSSPLSKTCCWRPADSDSEAASPACTSSTRTRSRAARYPRHVETAALLPIGFPASNAKYGPTTRAPVEEVTFRTNGAGLVSRASVILCPFY